MILDKKKKTPKACCSTMAAKYEPVRVLSEGFQDIVLLCKHRASGALVACKTSLSHYHHPCKRLHTTSIISKLNLLLSGRKKGSPITNGDIDAEQGHDERDPNILDLHSTFKSEDGFVHRVKPLGTTVT